MKAWQLIEKPENWCKGAYAKSATGEAVIALLKEVEGE